MTTLRLIIRALTPAENRWSDPKGFLSLLQSAASVGLDLPVEVGVGPDLPTGQNRPTLFIRTTPAGDFAGLYSFVAGAYRRIDNYPNVREIRGISGYTVGVTELAPGWHLADGTNGTYDRSSEFVGAAPTYDYAEIQYTGAA
jgi:hypothetical protein